MSDNPCCICNPKKDHNGMPCWSCWCDTLAVVRAARDLDQEISKLPAFQVADLGLNPHWFSLRGTIKRLRERGWIS